MYRKSYNSLDAAKLFMAICVVAIHTNPLYGCKNQTAVSIYTAIVSCAVPFFFICSGFLLGKKINQSKEDSCLAVKKSAVRMLKLYVIWSAIYLPPAIMDYISSGNSVLHNLAHYIKGFVVNGEHYNSWMLWYLLSSFYALVMVYFLLKHRLSIEKITVLGAVLLCGYFILSGINDYSSLLPGEFTKVKRLIDITIGNGKPLQGFFYIPLGILLSKKQINPRISAVVFIFSFIVTVLLNQSLGRITLVITAAALFCTVKGIEFPDSKAYFFMRKLSTGVYFIHLYAWMIVYFLMYGEKTYGLIPFLLTTALSVILSAIWILIDRKASKATIKNPA